MTGQAALELRYRRLLACYPASHRHTYGEEMIGVLLATARPGQRRPGIADAVDLFGGGARVRLRGLLTGSPGPSWRDTLALASLIIPIALVAMARITLVNWDPATARATAGLAGLLAILLAPVALALVGFRRVAALAAATAIGVLIQAAVSGVLDGPGLAAYIVLLSVQAFALAASPGPRHALGLVSVKGVLMAIPWLLTAAYMASLIPTHYPVPQLVARIGIALVAVAGLPALATSAGRRLVILIAGIPLSAMAVTILTFAGVDFYALRSGPAIFALYGPPVLMSALTFGAVTVLGRRSAPPQAGVAA
jgi:hypothetical protein